MAVTQNTYTGNGATVLYSFTFPYLDTADIKVSVNGTPTTAYTLANATTVQFNSAPANGAAVRIYRETDDAALAATYYPGSAIRAQDLNDSFTQILYKAQEINAYSVQDVGNVNLVANFTFSGTAAGQEPSGPSSFATKSYVDNIAFSSGNLTAGSKGDVYVNSANNWTVAPFAITTEKVATGAITNTKIGDNSVTAQKIEDGAIISSKLANSSVTPDKLSTTYATLGYAIALA